MGSLFTLHLQHGLFNQNATWCMSVSMLWSVLTDFVSWGFIFLVLFLMFWKITIFICIQALISKHWDFFFQCGSTALIFIVWFVSAAMFFTGSEILTTTKIYIEFNKMMGKLCFSFFLIACILIHTFVFYTVYLVHGRQGPESCPRGLLGIRTGQGCDPL